MARFNTENITGFSNDLDVHCLTQESFFNINLLMLFEKHFSYSDISLTSYNRDFSLSGVVSINGATPIADFWKQSETHLHDSFALAISERSSRTKGVQSFVTDSAEVLAKEDYFATDYYKYLNTMGFSWIVSVVIGFFRINFIKKNTPGEYERGEKDALSLLCGMLSHRYRLFINKRKNELWGEGMDEVLSESGTGCVVMSGVFDEAVGNSAAKDCLGQMFPSSSFNKACELLKAELIKVNPEILKSANRGAVISAINGYMIKTERKRSGTVGEAENDYYLVKITKTDDAEGIFSVNGFCERYSLTKRERDIFAYIIKGYSYQRISQELYLSINTVRYHIKNIYTKTGVKSRGELAALTGKYG